MQPAAREAPPSGHEGERHLPLVFLLFVASGCAALIYEIVWFQLLELVIGSTAASLAVVLGTFMGGLCVGSLALPRLIGRERHPLRVYAALEIGTGLLGLAVLFGAPAARDLYAAAVAPGLDGLPLRAGFAALCLLAPTVLMGATLPVIAHWLDATPRSIAWLGFLYGGNIAGAVLGCLLAGFYLLRVHDMATATYVAAAINGTAGVIAFVMAARLPYAPAAAHVPAADVSAAPVAPARRGSPAPRTSPAATVLRSRDARATHLTIALSGLTALGAEVLWTRVLSLRLGPTVYTFSIILAVVLIGLGVGSSLGSAAGRAMARPRIALGVCQMLLAAAIAWGASPLATSIGWRLGEQTPPAAPWVGLARDLASCLWVVFPSTILWGASFPLALASAARDARDTARVVGGIYAANTLGGIAGAVGFSLVVIPMWGTQQAARLLIVVATLAGLLMLLAVAWPARSASEAGNASGARVAGLIWLMAATATALLLMITVPPISPRLVAWGRASARQVDLPRILYVGEGANSSVAVTERADGVRAFHVAGKVEASTDPQDLRLERMLAHFPALVHPHPRSVLVVGFGAGITAGTFLMYPGIERVVICEIEPLIPPNVGPFFHRENLDVLHDPRVEIVYDDARHYILTSRERFDVITSDPIHPWVKGSATLYTREYYELARRRLNPGGVIAEWVPLYQSREEAVLSEVATFLDVVPGGTLWGSRPAAGGGYDLIILGQDGPTRIDADALQRRVTQPGYLPVIRSLVESGFGSMLDLFSTYVGDRASMAPALRGAQPNLDRNLRLQYLAGFAAGALEHERIYAHLVEHRGFPDALFTASPQWKAQLGEALARTR
ncbi:MAG: SAM-dependent methyltransferase [Gemmatimonadales bacterium]